MSKWLAIAGALLLVLLILMWKSMESSATPQREDLVQPAAATPTVATRTVVAKPTPAPAAVAEPAAVEEEPGKPAKLDPMGDEFFYKFIEEVPYKLSKQAVECYNDRTGSLHRNQKLVLAFTMKVKNGDVTVDNVHVKPPDDDEASGSKNTLNDPALESCFIQKVARTTWHDDSLPDYEWPDELTIRPERGLKKYWKSNRDYVGAEAPKDKKWEKH